MREPNWDHVFANSGRKHWVRPVEHTKLSAAAQPTGSRRYVIVRQLAPGDRRLIGFFGPEAGEWWRNLSEKRCERWWESLRDCHTELAVKLTELLARSAVSK
jgi:hypothetical protein